MRHAPEPWAEMQLLDTEGDSEICPRQAKNRHAVVMSEADYERARRCVNALKGVPDERLPEVSSLVGSLRGETVKRRRKSA